MAKRKAATKKATEYSFDCPCGEKVKVLELKRGYMAHCASCGTITFFDNSQLLERLRFSTKLCQHKLEPKPCRGGHTTWCSLCRIRTFYYDNGGTGSTVNSIGG